MSSYIQSIGIANPGERISQDHILGFMQRAHALNKQDSARLQALYRATGIKYRYSVIPDYHQVENSFYPPTKDLEPFPTIEDRMKVYQEKALGLAKAAISDCFSQLHLQDFSSVTHLITVSCTGMYAPGLDIELIETLGLSSNTERTSITYMGCYAAFNAIKIGDSICRSNPNAVILILCLELCSIHFQKKADADNMLANALFGDGAAALVQSSLPLGPVRLEPVKFHCDLIPNGKQDMAWNIGNFGFEMRLSSYVPEVIKSGVKQLSDRLLEKLQLDLSEIDYFALHPGGKRILEVIEDELHLTRNQNKYAFEVLRNYGNMSSPTVLFVLKKIVEDFRTGSLDHGYVLSIAFGPGLTLESMVLRLSRNQ